MVSIIQSFIKNVSFQKSFLEPLKRIPSKIAVYAAGVFAAAAALYCSYRVFQFYQAKKGKVQKKPNHQSELKRGKFPTVPLESMNWRNTFDHVDILNARGYKIKGKKIPLCSPAKPEKVEIDRQGGTTLGVAIKKLEKSPHKKMTIQVIDATTDEAIANGNSHKIALNFANAEHAGGGPGIYKDHETGKIVYQTRNDGFPFGSAFAQEEALVAKSTLMLSLLELGTLSDQRDSMKRNFYHDGEKNWVIDSTTSAYVSDDQLFAVRAKNEKGDYNFYQSQFLEEPVDVSFVTSAAENYGAEKLDENKKCVPNIIELTSEERPYCDAQMRIQTHLYAAAKKAVEMRKKDPEKPVKLVLGAFGCGAFAPHNYQEYAEMIAGIYLQELPKFVGFFDEVIFAIPKNLGTNEDTNRKSTENFNTFFKIFTA